MTTQPSCLEVLTWLDAIVDAFNGNHDPAPKDDPFHARITVWRKAYKYECEDLDEVVQSFFDFCGNLELKPGQTEAYHQVFKDAVAIQKRRETSPKAFEFWDKYVTYAMRALNRHFETPLAGMRQVSKNQLWLRAALRVDPQLPSPWPAWPLFIKDGLDRANANFTGGSENWTHENHDDATWARRRVLHEMKEKGWFDPAEAERLLNPEMAGIINAANKAKLASMGIYEVKTIGF